MSWRSSQFWTITLTAVQTNCINKHVKHQQIRRIYVRYLSSSHRWCDDLHFSTHLTKEHFVVWVSQTGYKMDNSLVHFSLTYILLFELLIQVMWHHVFSTPLPKYTSSCAHVQEDHSLGPPPQNAARTSEGLAGFPYEVASKYSKSRNFRLPPLYIWGLSYCWVSGSIWLLKLRDSLSVPSSRIKQSKTMTISSLKTGRIGCLAISVNSIHKLRKSAEERGPHLGNEFI